MASCIDIIVKLKEAINENKKSIIEECRTLLAKDIEECSKQTTFFNLSPYNVGAILEESGCTNMETIKRIIKGTVNIYPKTATVLLSSIKLPDATIDECFSLLQCFYKCPLISKFDECVLLSSSEHTRLKNKIQELNDALEEERCLVEIDNDSKIESLNKKLTNYEKLLAEYKNNVEEKDATICDIKSKNSLYENAIRTKIEEIEVLKEEIAFKCAKIENQNDKIIQLQSSLEYQKREVKRINQEKEEIIERYKMKSGSHYRNG